MKILILSHANANSGAIDRYEEYLRHEGHEVAKLEHPLDDYTGTNSTLWADGRVTERFARKAHGPLNLLEDLWLSIRTIRRNPTNLIIGANNFDTLSGLAARRLLSRRDTKVVYFASDFSEHRYPSAALNRVYFWFERRALSADLVISNTRRAEAKRLELGLHPNRSSVAVNAAQAANPDFPSKPLSKSEFIYVGSLTQEHGLHDFIAACSSLISRLTIIGSGPDEHRVLSVCHAHGVPVRHLGQHSHDWTMNFMSSFTGLALAPYSLGAARYVYYGSSLKIFEYLACGLPVITSDVTEQSSLVERHGLGIVYSRLDPGELSARVSTFPLQHFSDRARDFYSLFNQDTVFRSIPL